MVNAGRPMIFLRIGRFGIVMSSVPSCVPMIGSRSFFELVETRIVHPHVLRELELANEARTSDERRDASLDAVLVRAFGQRGTVGAAAADHPAPIHVHGRVAWIHAPDMRAQRHGVAVGIHLP